MGHPVGLVVTSHVGRDLLQSSAFFKHEWLVAWEYVSNGLQYIDHSTDPVVNVAVDQRSKTMRISDNGRGMTWNDLANYFVMHGENVDRKEGRPGRGLFGTGKSAAFGIAKTLRVRTVRNGLRSTVELDREDIERAKSGAPIPIKTIEKDVATKEENGTEVLVSNIMLRSIDHNKIIAFLERQIARWPRATVFVNHHRCEYSEPPIHQTFQMMPLEEPFLSAFPTARLTINVSKRPLEEWEQGVSVVSAGVLHETTLAGSKGREMSQYIFGEFNVPELAKDTSPISAFDMSRSGLLNPSNELVQRILAFIGFHVEDVRKQLLEEERKRKASQEAKQLDREAKEIAKIINSDFENYRKDLLKMSSQRAGGADKHFAHNLNGDDDSTLIPGDKTPAKEAEVDGGFDRFDEEGGVIPDNPSNSGPSLEDVAEEEATHRAERKKTTKKPASRGGFNVEFKQLGENQPRASYDRESRTIFINLDHPQILAAVGAGGTEEIAFRRLAYEVAFSEYAIALAVEMVHAQHFIDLFEPLTVTRETLNRVARSAASLYRPLRV